MGEFLFISLFLWWVVLFIMRNIREGQTARDTFLNAMPAFVLLSDQGGTDF
jgi:hypothetical protein